MTLPMNEQPSWKKLVDAAVKWETHSCWPTPITFRQPAAFDADQNQNVQVLTSAGWELCRWEDVDSRGGCGWQHTPIWTPQPFIDQKLRNELGELERIKGEIKDLLSAFQTALEKRP